MILNGQDSGRSYYEDSPSMPIHDPSFAAQPCPQASKSPLELPWPSSEILPEPEAESAFSRQDRVPSSSGRGPNVDMNANREPSRPEGTPEAGFASTTPQEWYPQYMACLQYFVDQAQHSPAVQSVAAFLNIRLPCQQLSNPVSRLSSSPSVKGLQTPAPPASYVSLRPYIRRLIVTGHDGPSVLSAFFGPNWQAGVGNICKQERVNYLFTAKSGGWASTKAAYDLLPDEQTPFLRALREPMEDEIREAEGRWSEWLAMEDWMVGPRSPW